MVLHNANLPPRAIMPGEDAQTTERKQMFLKILDILSINVANILEKIE